MNICIMRIAAQIVDSRRSPSSCDRARALQADPHLQGVKPRIVAQRIESVIEAQMAQPARMLTIGCFERVERAIGVSEADVDEGQATRRHVVMPCSFLQ